MPESRLYPGIVKDVKNDVWYHSQPLGKNMLGTLVQKATETAGNEMEVSLTSH